MNPRLRRRLDEEDVIQDAFLEASQRLADYLQNPQAPFFLWLRQIVHRRILKVHRQHLGLQLRDVRREAPVRWATTSAASSCVMAEQLLGRLTSPSGAAIRQEARLQLEKVLEGMSEVDREILSLRYFEHLTNEEAAAELGLEVSTASKRHVRALLRLEKAMADLGLGADAFQMA
jgi:RNA polymerase sigma-70 factor (ECF subfamily)